MFWLNQTTKEYSSLTKFQIEGTNVFKCNLLSYETEDFQFLWNFIDIFIVKKSMGIRELLE